jgi:serine/threonine-protein kinase
MNQPHDPDHPASNETGARYQLFSEIARGGMGTVLRGRDVDLGRDLAVKVLLQKHVHRPEVVRRFIEEAQIGAQLQHPGIPPVYDIGRFGEMPFFTMKLVKGYTLAALLGQESDLAAERPRRLRIALQVAQTLAYAHAKGVIHRDLKPANIAVGAFGEVQVMDWGLAKILHEGSIADEDRAGCQQREEATLSRTARSSGSPDSAGTQTEASPLLDTPAYMPPEQARGEIALLDRRSDVFGLGAILCEILTGKRPYVGGSAEEVRHKAANGDLADALLRLDGCGADQELLVLTKACLSPKAIDRPRDAQAVADALTAYLDGVQERLHQAEVARAVEQAKRRILACALAAMVLLVVTLCGGSWLWVKADRDARHEQVMREVNEALNQATALRERAKSASAGGEALFAQAREQAQRAVALAEIGPADAVLAAQVLRLQAELDEHEKDRTLVAALDAARLAHAETLSENRFALERAVPLFREAFQAYGLPVGEGEPAAAAQRIRQRLPAVREAILSALDEWDDLAGNPRLRIAERHRAWLRAVLEAAEPDDAWGRKVRAARRETDPAKRQAALEALAESADVKKLPARALTRLARLLPLPRAVALLRRAQQQYPTDFWVNHNLGVALLRAEPPGREEGVRFLTAGAALRPDSAGALLNLGNALRETGRAEEAIACYRKAIELDPKLALAHEALSLALFARGRYAEARLAASRSLALLPERHPKRSDLTRQVQTCERLLKLEARLPRLLRGEERPVSVQENLDLATMCRHRRLHAAAVRFAAAAFTADPKVTSNLNALHRYHAACSGCLAAAGQGEDAAGLDASERSRLRKQAIDWLRADLAGWTHLQDGSPSAARAAVQKAMKHWQQDPDLASIRDPAALAQLPADERGVIARLWAEVAALLKKAETPTSKEGKP